MSAVAREGQSLLAFCSAVCQFRELNALLASTRRTPSVSFLLNRCLTQWIPASIPAICPAQSCVMPTASWMSPFVTERIALDIIHLTVSQFPIGSTPGFLFRAMSLHAMRDETLDGSTSHVQRR